MTGEMYPGKLVYIRGSKLRFIVVPDMLKNAPMFKIKTVSKSGAARGKSALLRAQGVFVLVPCRRSYPNVLHLSASQAGGQGVSLTLRWASSSGPRGRCAG